MTEERFVKTRLVLHIIQAAAIIIAALSLWLGYKSMRDQHELERRQYTFILINESNKQLIALREPLRTAFNDLYEDKKARKLTQADAENLFHACSDFPQNTSARQFTCDARGAAGSYLNFLDYIAVAHWNHIADRALVEATLGGMLVDDYDYFENFIKHVSDARKRKAWGSLQNVVTYIKHGNIPVSPSRTGEF